MKLLEQFKLNSVIANDITYVNIAAAQNEFKDMLENCKNVKFNYYPIEGSSKKIICEVSRPNFPRPLIPSIFTKDIIKEFHNLSHPGIKATRDLIAKRCFWFTMKKDIQLFVKSCLKCQIAKINRHTHPPVGRFTGSPGRFEHVHIDVVGPLPVCKSYTHLLTIVDRNTRWMEAIPICDTSANTIARALVYNYISRFGVPQIITSDKGAVFLSALFNEIKTLFGIKWCYTTPYHPQASGQVER